MAPVQNASTREGDTGGAEGAWRWLEGLIHDASREEHVESLARRVFQWDLAVRQFRKLEHDRIVLASPSAADLEGHALCLEGLLMIGRALVLACKQYSQEELGRFGIKQDEPEAGVAALEQSFREWHHGFSDERLAEVRDALFGGKA